MFRRSLTLPLALLTVAATTAGCATFSDSDSIARVGDVSLTQDDFEAQLTDLGVDESDALNAEPVRGEITRWIQEQLADQPVDTDGLEAAYASGIQTSGAVCVAAIVVEDEGTADSVAADLEGGMPFVDALTEFNIDQQLATTGGSLACLTDADLEFSADVPFIAASAGLDADHTVAIAPLPDEAGTVAAWVVLNFRPFSELDELDIAVVAAAQQSDVDVYVDPRYGSFDSTTRQVVGLG
ncbi:MAG: hypothetical protein WBP59_04315 [Ilumatobacteraceae bacterium]